ncbi:UvrD-helicase domain-containing protein [Rhodovulum marinum]|uniref:DNA helicase-2/ATP-dependent DNA helicase PcrA n=1 Tax=Rhodovulum marinum TaxID=320662 RepID=A0A4R2PVV3_9RHOB|nr:UvrD-helicase domain-containing protein [Rhodovulum marinum]TCP39384.1 DNA helicase-2/ATP-dependent DNA helicase PcrA [Rhodovulum marinum]
MSDHSVFNLLRSDEPLVVIEAPAGCGKTYQGAEYAHDIAPTLGNARMLILTHTNAACDVFEERTRGISRNAVEIRTIDAMICEIAAVYHKVLDLPPDPTVWAYTHNGFSDVAARVAVFIKKNQAVPAALARRYPIIVCDEHQDASPDHHQIIMAIHGQGAKLRIFGDRMQSIYESKAKAAEQHRARWEALVASAAHDELDHPHRWTKDAEGCSELGEWVLSARETLLANEPLDLTSALPASVKVIVAENTSPARGGYRVGWPQRKPLDDHLNGHEELFVLASSNELVRSLRSFWNRKVPIWEGHTRDALSILLTDIQSVDGNAVRAAEALTRFMSSIAKGFTSSTHGNILKDEIECNCGKARKGKPGNIQGLARMLLAEPNHLGISTAIAAIDQFIKSSAAGFSDVKVDLKREFREAQRLAQYEDASQGYAEIAMRRSVIRPKPLPKTLSTVHKSKGLECSNTMIMHCDRASFGNTIYGRCKFYVGISRAKSSLVIVIPKANPSLIFKIP